MMQYVLKEVKAVSNPFTKKVNGIDKYGINIVVTTGIVSQTYIGFCNCDNMFFELNKSDTIDQSQTKMNAFATQFVATKYPNT